MRLPAWLAWVLVLVLSAPLAAQTPSSSLTGTVVDTTGAAVPDVGVSLFGPARRDARTDAEGRFSFDALPPGDYRVSAVHPGFAPVDVRVTLNGANEPLTVTLDVADVTAFVETVSKVPEQVLRTPFLASEVTGEELQRSGAITFEEALRSVPGLQHGTQGNAFTRVSTRGLRDTADVLVLLDGVPFRQLNGSADLTMLPVPAMQGIEFVKGPASSMYGRSAIGGVMQVFTVPDPSERPSGDVRAGYSSFDTRELNGTAQLPWNGGRLAGVFALSRADGFQERTGRDASFGSITVDQTVRSRAQLKLQYIASDVEAGRGSIIPLQNGQPLFGITREQNFGIPGARFDGTLHSVTQRTDLSLGGTWLVTNALNFNRYDRYSTGGITIVPPPTASNKGWNESTARQDTTINDATVRWETGTAAVRSSFVAGFTIERGTQDQDSPAFANAPTFRGPDYTNPVPGATAGNDLRGVRGAVTNSAFDQTILSLYLQERLERGRAGVVLGLRWDDFDQSLTRSDSAVVSADSRSRVSPRVGVDLVALQRDRTSLVTFVNWVEGFRPQFPALSTQAGLIVPQLLRPEVTRSVEGGVKLQHGPASGQISVFNMRKIDGQRSFRTGPDDFTFVNATTRVRGTEMEGRLRARGGHTVWAHYAHHDARHVEFRPTLTTSFDGFRLRMAPSNIGGVGGTIMLSRVAWTTSLNYVGSRPLRDNVVNPQQLPSYTTLDTSASLRVGAARLVLFATNLTDEFYISDDFSSQDAGNAGPPRRVGVQVGYSF